VPSATATTATKISSTRPTSVDGLELKRLFTRWQRHGDRAARETLVRRFMPLARSLARRYGSAGSPAFVNGILDRIHKGDGDPGKPADGKSEEDAVPLSASPSP